MISSYEGRSPVYTPELQVIDLNKPEVRMRMIKEVSEVRYGRRGDNNYYMSAAIFDGDILERLNREHLFVTGRSYYEIIDKMYDALFSNTHNK